MSRYSTSESVFSDSLTSFVGASILLLGVPLSSIANPTELGTEPLPEPIKAEVGTNCYLITSYTVTPASQSSWGEAEAARGFVNTPWAPNGDSPSLASKYGSYAFLADPAYYYDDKTGTAKYVLATPKKNSRNGIFITKIVNSCVTQQQLEAIVILIKFSSTQEKISRAIVKSLAPEILTIL